MVKETLKRIDEGAEELKRRNALKGIDRLWSDAAIKRTKQWLREIMSSLLTLCFFVSNGLRCVSVCSGLDGDNARQSERHEAGHDHLVGASPWNERKVSRRDSTRMEAVQESINQLSWGWWIRFLKRKREVIEDRRKKEQRTRRTRTSKWFNNWNASSFPLLM